MKKQLKKASKVLNNERGLHQIIIVIVLIILAIAVAKTTLPSLSTSVEKKCESSIEDITNY